MDETLVGRENSKQHDVLVVISYVTGAINDKVESEVKKEPSQNQVELIDGTSSLVLF